MQFTIVKAPFSSIMNHIPGQLDSLVDEGDLLATLSDNSTMWAYSNVPEAEYLACKTYAKSSDETTQVKQLMANNAVFNQTAVLQTIRS